MYLMNCDEKHVLQSNMKNSQKPVMCEAMKAVLMTPERYKMFGYF